MHEDRRGGGASRDSVPSVEEALLFINDGKTTATTPSKKKRAKRKKNKAKARGAGALEASEDAPATAGSESGGQEVSEVAAPVTEGEASSVDDEGAGVDGDIDREVFEFQRRLEAMNAQPPRAKITLPANVSLTLKKSQ